MDPGVREILRKLQPVKRAAQETDTALSAIGKRTSGENVNRVLDGIERRFVKGMGEAERYFATLDKFQSAVRGEDAARIGRILDGINDKFSGLSPLIKLTQRDLESFIQGGITGADQLTARNLILANSMRTIQQATEAAARREQELRAQRRAAVVEARTQRLAPQATPAQTRGQRQATYEELFGDNSDFAYREAADEINRRVRRRAELEARRNAVMQARTSRLTAPQDDDRGQMYEGLFGLSSPHAANEVAAAAQRVNTLIGQLTQTTDKQTLAIARLRAQEAELAAAFGQAGVNEQARAQALEQVRAKLVQLTDAEARAREAIRVSPINDARARADQFDKMGADMAKAREGLVRLDEAQKLFNADLQAGYISAQRFAAVMAELTRQRDALQARLTTVTAGPVNDVQAIIQQYTARGNPQAYGGQIAEDPNILRTRQQIQQLQEAYARLRAVQVDWSQAHVGDNSRSIRERIEAMRNLEVEITKLIARERELAAAQAQNQRLAQIVPQVTARNEAEIARVRAQGPASGPIPLTSEMETAESTRRREYHEHIIRLFNEEKAAAVAMAQGLATAGNASRQLTEDARRLYTAQLNVREAFGKGLISAQQYEAAIHGLNVESERLHRTQANAGTASAAAVNGVVGSYQRQQVLHAGLINSFQSIAAGQSVMSSLYIQATQLVGVFGNLSTILLAIGAATIVGGFGKLAQSIASVGDAANETRARINALTNDAQETTRIYDRLYNLSRQTGADPSASARDFTGLLTGAQAIGATNDQVLRLTESFQKLSVIGGGSAQELNAGMRQFVQALGSGRLNGDELRSIFENMRPLVRELSAALGKSTEELRRMGEEGRLTADVVFNALLSRSRQIDEAFARMPVTMARAFDIAKAEATQFLDRLNQALGVSQAIAGALSRLGGMISSLRQGIGLLSTEESRAREEVSLRQEIETARTQLTELRNANDRTLTEAQRAERTRTSIARDWARGGGASTERPNTDLARRGGFTADRLEDMGIGGPFQFSNPEQQLEATITRATDRLNRMGEQRAAALRAAQDAADAANRSAGERAGQQARATQDDQTRTLLNGVQTRERIMQQAADRTRQFQNTAIEQERRVNEIQRQLAGRAENMPVQDRIAMEGRLREAQSALRQANEGIVQTERERAQAISRLQTESDDRLVVSLRGREEIHRRHTETLRLIDERQARNTQLLQTNRENLERARAAGSPNEHLISGLEQEARELERDNALRADRIRAAERRRDEELRREQAPERRAAAAGRAAEAAARRAEREREAAENAITSATTRAEAREANPAIKSYFAVSDAVGRYVDKMGDARVESDLLQRAQEALRQQLDLLNTSYRQQIESLSRTADEAVFKNQILALERDGSRAAVAEIDRLTDARERERLEAQRRTDLRQLENDRMAAESRLRNAGTQELRNEAQAVVDRVGQQVTEVNQQYDRQIQATLDPINSRTARNLAEVQKKALDSATKAAADFLYDAMEGKVNDVGDALGKSLKRGIADAFAEEFIRPLLRPFINTIVGSLHGLLGTGGGGSGGIQTVLQLVGVGGGVLGGGSSGGGGQTVVLGGGGQSGSSGGGSGTAVVTGGAGSLQQVTSVGSSAVYLVRGTGNGAASGSLFEGLGNLFDLGKGFAGTATTFIDKMLGTNVTNWMNSPAYTSPFHSTGAGDLGAVFGDRVIGAANQVTYGQAIGGAAGIAGGAYSLYNAFKTGGARGWAEGVSGAASIAGGAATLAGGATAAAAGTALGAIATVAPYIAVIAAIVAKFLPAQKPSNREGNATVNLDTKEVIIGGQTGDKFSETNRSAARGMTDTITKFTEKMERAYGVNLTGQVKVGVGDRDGMYSEVNGRRIGNFSADEEGSQEMMRRTTGAILAANLAAFSGNYRTALETVGTEDLEVVTKALDFVKNVYDPLVRASEASNAFRESMRQLEEQYEAIAEEAELYGLATDKIYEALEKAKQRLIDARDEEERDAYTALAQRQKDAQRRPNTLENVLADFEEKADDQRREMATWAEDRDITGDRYTAMLAKLNETLSAEKAAAIRDFAEAIDKINQSLEDRYFAATTDTNTLEGALAAYERQAMRERQEAVEQGLADINLLERTQAAERQKIIDNYTERLLNAGKTIRAYIDTLRSTPAAGRSATDQFQTASLLFERDITLARQGDEDALARITQTADNLLKAGSALYGSTQGFVDIRAYIEGALANLPATVEYDRKVLDKLAQANDNLIFQRYQLEIIAQKAGGEAGAGIVRAAVEAGYGETIAALNSMDQNWIAAVQQNTQTTSDYIGNLTGVSASWLQGIHGTLVYHSSLIARTTLATEAASSSTNTMIAWSQEIVNQIHNLRASLEAHTNGNIRAVYDNITALIAVMTSGRGGGGGGGGGGSNYVNDDSTGTGGGGSAGDTPGGEAARGAFFWPKGGYAFAQGGAFTNTVVDRPTHFRFGGSKLGLMGEAGPEAIMPLGRRNGKLSVWTTDGDLLPIDRGPGGKLSVNLETFARGEMFGGGGGDDRSPAVNALFQNELLTLTRQQVGLLMQISHRLSSIETTISNGDERIASAGERDADASEAAASSLRDMARYSRDQQAKDAYGR